MPSTCTRYIYHDHYDACTKLTFIVEYYIHVVSLYSTRYLYLFVLLGSAPAVSVPGIYIMIILIHVPN